MTAVSPRRRWLAPLIAFAAIYLGYYAAAAFVLGVDPLDLYPWGRHAAASHDIAVVNQMVLLPREIADPEADILIVGGSTSAGYSSAQLRRWIPGARHPLNLSYGAPSLVDTRVVLEQVLRRSTARRVIVFYGPAYFIEGGSMRPDFPLYLLNATTSDDLRAINPTTFGLAVQAVLGRELYAETREFPNFVALRQREYEQYQSPAPMRKLDQRMVAARPILAAQTASIDCANYPGVRDALVPFARAIAARGVSVDIVMPLTSRALYGQAQFDLLVDAAYRHSFFPRDIASRRCLVNMLAGQPGVRIFAFDDDWIVGDMANYRDTAHIESDRASSAVFAQMARGEHQLTRDNVEAYLASYRAKALAYRVHNSRVPGFH